MRTRLDRGAATVLTLALLGLLVFTGAALSVVAAIFSAHRSAQAAADLAALAGAVAVTDAGDPCAAAGTTAVANGARLTSCTVIGRDVRVEVVVVGPSWRGLTSVDLVAEARAGPAG